MKLRKSSFTLWVKALCLWLNINHSELLNSNHVSCSWDIAYGNEIDHLLFYHCPLLVQAVQATVRLANICESVLPSPHWSTVSLHLLHFHNSSTAPRLTRKLSNRAFVWLKRHMLYPLHWNPVQHEWCFLLCSGSWISEKWYLLHWFFSHLHIWPCCRMSHVCHFLMGVVLRDANQIAHWLLEEK